jgi:hypothetical protein
MSNLWWLGTNRRPRSSSDSAASGNAVPEPKLFTQNEFSESQLQEQMKLSKQYSIVQAMLDGSLDGIDLEAPEAADLKSKDDIVLDSCRRCSDVFQYTWMRHTTKVIVGVPKIPEYKVASYVWGETQPLPLQCRACGEVTTVPMQSAYKFRRLMALADNTGDSIWVDAISIDQSDPEDVNSQLAVMGDIYSNAKSVGVLLPREDKAPFKLLHYIAFLASCINSRRLEFSRNQESLGAPGPSLSNICAQFYKAIEEFESGLPGWLYWSRAWTFQEWALANDFSITWEGPPLLPNFAGIKGVIISAATLLAVYKLKMVDYATIKQPFSRGLVPRKFQTVKRLFPDERAFIPPEFMEEDEVNMSMISTALLGHAGISLGIFNVDRLPGRFQREPPVHQSFSLDMDLPKAPDTKFFWRLSMALNALGTHKRQARYEADLVASWASMCNIKYEYNKDDKFPIALQKVVRAIRTRLGKPIYNFHVNTVGSGGEVDLNFLDYATGHKQSNSTNDSYFHGTPIFTGRADAATHFRLSLSQPKSLVKLDGSGIALRKVLNSSVSRNSDWASPQSILTTWCSAISGSTDEGYQFNFTDVVNDVANVLFTVPREQLEDKVLVTAKLRISQRSESAEEKALMTWAICRDSFLIEDVFVAREDLNGTLVLASKTETGYSLIAYLTITDQQCGTMLLKLNAKGCVDMTLITPLRGDVFHSVMLRNRTLLLQIPLEENSVVAF